MEFSNFEEPSILLIVENREILQQKCLQNTYIYTYSIHITLKCKEELWKSSTFSALQRNLQKDNLKN